MFDFDDILSLKGCSACAHSQGGPEWVHLSGGTSVSERTRPGSIERCAQFHLESPEERIHLGQSIGFVFYPPNEVARSSSPVVFFDMRTCISSGYDRLVFALNCRSATNAEDYTESVNQISVEEPSPLYRLGFALDMHRNWRAGEPMQITLRFSLVDTYQANSGVLDAEYNFVSVLGGCLVCS